MDNEYTWSDPSLYINKFYVEESCVDLPYTQEILARARHPFSIVPERGKPNNTDDDFVDNLSRGKRQLYLCENRGMFFKPCPGTREYQCCEYQVLNIGSNCPIDCAYCILQAYLNTPWLTYYVNIDQLFLELRGALTANSESFFRIGTGEFTDSLALDRITCLSRPLVEFIANFDNAVLELKTKSGFIDNLCNLKHKGRTVVAWSLNSRTIMARLELRSATLAERLNAARRCADWGYRLAFHFDPIIDHPGWEVEYTATIDTLFATVPASSIAWISLGALRFIPSLKNIGIKRFPKSKIYYNEFVLGLDGKYRYFREDRVRLYSFLYNYLKKRASETTCIYFCMESEEIWQEVMGFIPAERGGIAKMLDNAVR